MCKFNPQVTTDEDNYEVVEGNMIELYERAVQQLGEKSHTVIKNPSEASSLVSPTPVSIMPSEPRDTLAPSLRQDDDDLTRRLQQLRS